jgi:hypothetical protein
MRRSTPVSDADLLLYVRVPPGNNLAVACLDLEDEWDELLDSRANLLEKTGCAG